MSQPPTTRASLILRLRHPDDAAAWEEFVAIYQPLIFRLAKSRGCRMPTPLTWLKRSWLGSLELSIGGILIRIAVRFVAGSAESHAI